ncbi:MAG: FAD-binding oxidoreductase [Proteobacteria bacterium]|nr:FAD-binding oxidoreductase [Pseudomonadota bacterium]
MDGLDQWLDVAGLMPPLPADVSQRLFSKTGGDSSGSHTFIPNLLTETEFYTHVLPQLQRNVAPDIIKFIVSRISKTFMLRKKLAELKSRIEDIVGTGNFSALWLDREAFSADSMEHRALVTEAVIHVYSASALQKLVKLLYTHKIPMIPYGEGGGYNMGVTPMAPAVTVSLRGIDHISDIRPSRRCNGLYEVTVGAGVPFKDLVAYLAKRGFVLRCDPNTPRAATGGIAATGSNGGRKAYEVIIHGRAVTARGAAACFAPDEKETRDIESEPFLMARKFFSIRDTSQFEKEFKIIAKRELKAVCEPSPDNVTVPLKGMKAAANMLAQRAARAEQEENFGAHDTMADSPKLPLSAFIGAEGTTGFIYEVTFEVEKRRAYLSGARWHFSSVEAAICVTRAIKSLPQKDHPEYFEIITGHSIRKFLLQDFPKVFSPSDEAVIILSVEEQDFNSCKARMERCEATAIIALADAGLTPTDHMRHIEKTDVLDIPKGIHEFEVMKRPREELPKKLRTKCKTDMEIRSEYLPEVLRIVDRTKPARFADQKQDVLFGHLTPRHTAIIHWNIGGFDLYDEEQSSIAWDYLEKVISEAQNLAPSGDLHGSARFTGEHGVAGKAAFLWINHIPKNDFERMCKIKDTLDPDDLFNPETLFLRTSLSRSLRARLLNVSSSQIQDALRVASPSEKQSDLAAERLAVEEGQKCTRCNSCKVCPVIDAEHQLESKGQRAGKSSALPSKRNVLMFMERIAVLRASARSTKNNAQIEKVISATNKMLAESAQLLKKCFYCRRCDKSCPVNIEIHPLMRAYHTMGKLPSMGSRLWGFLYDRLMGEDFFKAYTYKLIAMCIQVSMPVLNVLRRSARIPDWLKTYTVPPTLSVNHYIASEEGHKINPSDNFVLIKKDLGTAITASDVIAPDTIYIRYRGCMDTFGMPQATSSVDTYFKNVLGVRLVDLEKKMCCGFPYEAEGLHERALQAHFNSLVEIAKCIYRLVEEWRSQGSYGQPKFVMFSNCPTCCEAIREFKNLLKQPEKLELLKARASLPSSFDLNHLNYETQDTAEIAMELLKRSAAAKKEKIESLAPAAKFDSTVGLKVPCHNTKQATEAQLSLLKLYYKGVEAYDNCCGLSGTSRLKHPRIGTQIAENLFDQIRSAPADVVVSGCPSCRDGVKIQQGIMQARKDMAAEFEISGIFTQIVQDLQLTGAPASNS